MQSAKSEVIQKVYESMPETLTRKEACEFIGNSISPKTLRNLDCLNKGPKNKFIVGNKIAYSKNEFLKWFAAYQHDSIGTAKARSVSRKCKKNPHYHISQNNECQAASNYPNNCTNPMQPRSLERFITQL